MLPTQWLPRIPPRLRYHHPGQSIESEDSIRRHANHLGHLHFTKTVRKALVRPLAWICLPIWLVFRPYSGRSYYGRATEATRDARLDDRASEDGLEDEDWQSASDDGAVNHEVPEPEDILTEGQRERRKTNLSEYIRLNVP
jgi:hypothetical protein